MGLPLEVNHFEYLLRCGYEHNIRFGQYSFAYYVPFNSTC